ncbi:putative telomere-associated protein Rif1 [Plasmopara halstedii]
MEAAELQIARALAMLIEHEFPQSRSLETRLDAYLHLEELMRLEDTEASVREMQRHVPVLLHEMRFDLQHNVLSDIQHATLRCLSYLLHHRSLNEVFKDDDVIFFLSALLGLLFSTQDLRTYKLCVWGLTQQNFPVERHNCLSQTIEGLVHAVVNPFNSREIEVQALKGLLLLLVKYPEPLGANETYFRVYMRPIASRLSSSEVATRTQARLVLEEACKHRTNWSHETLTMVQNCAMEYFLPIMKSHTERNRLRDAIHLWKLVLVILKSRFTCEPGKLNQILYVPEKCMENEDAAVRLMSMQAWGDIIDIIHECQNWLFNKAVVSLLVWPIKLCLEQEVLLNVLGAAFTSWQKIVKVAVVYFNFYCKTQGQNDGQWQNAPEWKFWFSELVMSPLVTLMTRHMQANDNALTAEVHRFVKFTMQMWEDEEQMPSKSTHNSIPSQHSSCTTIEESMDGSDRKQSVFVVSRKSDVNESCSVDDLKCSNFRITTGITVIAFMLEDIFGAIQTLIKIADDCYGIKSQEQVNDLLITTWRGICKRNHVVCTTDGSLSNHGLRFVRMSIDFVFGLLNIRSSFADMRDENAYTNQVNINDKNQAALIAGASVGFGLEWQLQLLAPLVSNLPSSTSLRTVMLHPRSKLFDHITKRMEYLKKIYVQCATVLDTWKYDKSNKIQLDFTAKYNTLPYLVLNLLVEFAIYVDDPDNVDCERTRFIFANLSIVIRKLLKSVETSALQHAEGLNAIIRFSENTLHVACNFVFDDGERAHKSILDELVIISKRSARQFFVESLQTASLLLDLHHSLEVPGLFVSETASTDTLAISSDALDADQPIADVGILVSASYESSTSLPSTVSGEIARISKRDPADSNPVTLVDAAPVTPQQAKIIKRKDDKEHTTDEPKAHVKSQSAPPSLDAGFPQRLSLKSLRCIYPDLVGCSEGIALLYRHFPLSFRPFFSFYKIKTIGDLSALPVEKVRTFGLKDPISTVRRALKEFNGRKDRMKTLTGSPFCQRSSSATRSSASICTQFKRSLHPESGIVAYLEGPKIRKHKRVRRFLVLDTEGGDGESEKNCRKPKLADRVTFCLQTGEIGQTSITRPGEDSQDQPKPFATIGTKKDLQKKMNTYSLKLIQHLQRSVNYIDKLVIEEQSIQSEEGSLQTSIASVGGVITNYQEAHELVSRLALLLQIAAETSSTRCRKLLNKEAHEHA